MKRLALALIIIATVALQGAAASAQCTKDTDCKGNRICQNGECVAPAPAPPPPSGYNPAPAPAPAPAPPPEPRGPVNYFQSGYATIALLLSFHGWGGYTETWEFMDDEEYEGELDGDFMPGFRLAGYGVVSESFHIGGYWTFFKADFEVDPDDGDSPWWGDGGDLNVFMNMLGLTMKFGTRLHERIWLGGATDIGLLISKGEIDGWGNDLEMKPMVGPVIFPRIDLDIMIVDTGGFKLAFTAAFGLFVTPFSGGHPYDSDDINDELEEMGYDVDTDEIKERFWWLSPSLMLGLTLGA